MEKIAFNDLMPGDVVFYNDHGKVRSQMLNVICVEWQSDCVMVFGFNPITGERLSIPSPFNILIEVWN